MARKSAGPTALNTSFKAGDVIWVPYRKSPRWPAVIKNVYPKKLTYYFLPETGPRPSTFKTTPKSAALFKETDTIPDNAPKDLQAAYKAALAIVRGEAPVRRSLSSSNHRHSESNETVSPSTSNNSSLIDIPSSKKPRRTTESGKEFVEYTVILVESVEDFDWPALLTDVSGTLATVRKFPFTENKDVLNFPYARCRNVTYDEIGQLIRQYDTGDCGMYVRALVAAEEFMENPHKFLNAPQGFELIQRQLNQKQEKTPKKEKDVKDIVMKEDNIPPAAAIPTKPKGKILQNGLSLSNLSLSTSKNIVFKAMLSLDARDYIEQIWAGQTKSDRAERYQAITHPNDATFCFSCGDLLDFNELEIVIAEVRNWIALSPKLPKMTLLREMHYISKVVLPEICIFALGRIKNLSHTDAEVVYRDSVSKLSLEDPSTVSKSNNSFEQLLRAVSIERSAPGR